jgi:UDP-N-acetylglucosamine 4,6-dehydratase/5-epimerase
MKIRGETQSVLITGATGSFGNAMVSSLMANKKVSKIVVFSRDELKQYEMRKRFQNNNKLRWFLGDIRDESRLARAFRSIDIVIHAAALKQVDTAEYNPIEFVKTNVYGSQNVIEAAIDCGVKKVVALSTDKASSPINLYGATKLTADKLFISAKSYSTPKGTKFSVVRYGNVGGSRGSVIPHLLDLNRRGLPLTVTDMGMTRFHIRLEQAVDLVHFALRSMSGGELFVPEIPSYRLKDLVSAINPKAKIDVVGVRPGEKIHEEMISLDEGRRTYYLNKCFAVVPENFIKPVNARKVPTGFYYTSDNNPRFLNLKELKEEVNLIEGKLYS